MLASKSTAQAVTCIACWICLRWDLQQYFLCAQILMHISALKNEILTISLLFLYKYMNQHTLLRLENTDYLTTRCSNVHVDVVKVCEIGYWHL